MSEKNRKLMSEWVDEIIAVGGTDFTEAFDMAFKVITDSKREGHTSGCQGVLLFLTDGAHDTEKEGPFDLSRVTQLNKDHQYKIMSYSFGNDADVCYPKSIACQNGGIWYAVPDGQPIDSVMAQYYKLLAEGVDNEQVRWTEY